MLESDKELADRGLLNDTLLDLKMLAIKLKVNNKLCNFFEYIDHIIEGIDFLLFTKNDNCTTLDYEKLKKRVLDIKYTFDMILQYIDELPEDIPIENISDSENDNTTDECSDYEHDY